MPKPNRMFVLRFYSTERGVKPVREFLRKLDPKTRRKCYSYLNKVRVYGLQIGNHIVEKLQDNLWEIKPEYNNVEYRFFVGIIGPGYLGVVDVAVKKTMKLKGVKFDTAAARVKAMIGK